MAQWIDKLTDDTFRHRLGRRFEALTGEAFHVLRWTILVGFTRYLSVETGALWFDVIHWATSAMLFGYLASRFLLRPEIPIFAHRDARWKRRVQTAVNYVLCMAVFMLVMHALNTLVEGMAMYRFGPNG